MRRLTRIPPAEVDRFVRCRMELASIDVNQSTRHVA
jgi:hypothetical protein